MKPSRKKVFNNDFVVESYFTTTSAVTDISGPLLKAANPFAENPV